MASATRFRIWPGLPIEGSRQLAAQARRVPKPDWQNLTILDGRRGSVSGRGAAPRRQRRGPPIPCDRGPQKLGDELGRVPGSNGFGMNPMQPALTSWFASAAVPDVNATVGMPRVAASDLRRTDHRQTAISGM